MDLWLETRLVQAALIFNGLILVTVAWTRFRLPGTAMPLAAPVWRSHRYLTPRGVALQVAGLVMATFGVALLVL